MPLPQRLSRALPVLLGACAGAALAGGALQAALRHDVHFALTRSGMATVFTTHDSDGNAVRMLRIGGVYQSATYLDERRFEPPFAYYRAFDRLFAAETNGTVVSDVLMIGGGGFAYPKHALSTHKDLRMDVVEIDPAVVKIARRWFFLDELEALCNTASGERLRVVCADGLSYVDGCTRRYDAIVNDAFSGKEPVASLASAEAARSMKRCLKEGGLYLTNVVSRAEGTDIGCLQRTVGTLQLVFDHVTIIPCTDDDFGGEDNYLVVAS